MERRILHVEAPHYCAGAILEKVNGRWECVEAAPIIKWMEGKPITDTKKYLDGKGFNSYVTRTE